MSAIQLEFFKTEEQCEIEQMRHMCNAMKTSMDKCRKAQFASIGEIKKQVYEISERLNIIERSICRGKQ